MDGVNQGFGVCLAQNDNIERLASDRFAVYRRCKLDEIELPLAGGSASLESVPIKGIPDQDMDVDGPEDETQQAARVKDFGVQVDFDELDDDQVDDGAEAMNDQLAGEIAKIEAELEKMSPNLKAIERLGDSETRLNEINNQFEDARETTKHATDAFNKIKKERTDLFNKGQSAPCRDTQEFFFADLAPSVSVLQRTPISQARLTGSTRSSQRGSMPQPVGWPR